METFDNATAHSEGWGLFECGNSEGGPWQIQRVDEGARFRDDAEAWAHVLRRAASGSAYHAEAVAFISMHNPVEYDRYTRE